MRPTLYHRLPFFIYPWKQRPDWPGETTASRYTCLPVCSYPPFLSALIKRPLIRADVQAARRQHALEQLHKLLGLGCDRPVHDLHGPKNARGAPQQALLRDIVITLAPPETAQAYIYEYAASMGTTLLWQSDPIPANSFPDTSTFPLVNPLTFTFLPTLAVDDTK